MRNIATLDYFYWINHQQCDTIHKMNLRFLSLYILSKYNIIVDLIIFHYYVIETVVPYRDYLLLRNGYYKVCA